MAGVSASAMRLTEKAAVLPSNATGEVPAAAASIPEATNDEAQQIVGAASR